MADDKKNIPDVGKVDNPPEPGKVEPVKAAPPVQDQPAPAKADASVVEGAPKVATPPAAEQPAPADKAAPKDKDAPAPSMEGTPQPGKDEKQTTIPGMGDPAPAGKVVDFTAARDATRGVKEDIVYLNLSELHPFKNHPFSVRDDAEMQGLVESVKAAGVNQPALVRPREGGGYEIISGHRRQHAAQLAGLDTLPVIVRNMDDNAAVLLMVDSNLQRENILPSERAFAYKMKLEALKKQGARSDLTSSQVGMKLQALDIVGREAGDSRNQVHRFIRLTNLIPELLNMVDEKKIAFNPAVELSYLDEAQQRDFLEAMEDTQNAPSLSQAQRLKKLALEGRFSYDVAFAVMGEAKKDELDKVVIKNETLRKYFPRSYTPKQMEDIIIKLLEQWQRKRQRQNER